MKTLLFAIMLLGSIKSYSQGVQIRIDTASIYNQRQLLISDSGAISITGMDSISAIKMILTTMRHTDSLNNLMSDILDCMTTGGFVLNKDRIKFIAAVKAYKKFRKDKSYFVPMLWNDILVRDKKGKTLGWIKQ